MKSDCCFEFHAGAMMCCFSGKTHGLVRVEYRVRNSLHAEALVAGQRVCLFWPHDGTSALGIHCGPVIHCMPKHSLQASVCVFSDRMMAHQHLEFVAGQRVCLFWPQDGVSAAVIHCTRSHCSNRNFGRVCSNTQALHTKSEALQNLIIYEVWLLFRIPCWSNDVLFFWQNARVSTGWVPRP